MIYCRSNYRHLLKHVLICLQKMRLSWQKVAKLWVFHLHQMGLNLSEMLQGAHQSKSRENEEWRRKVIRWNSALTINYPNVIRSKIVSKERHTCLIVLEYFVCRLKIGKYLIFEYFSNIRCVTKVSFITVILHFGNKLCTLVMN